MYHTNQRSSTQTGRTHSLSAKPTRRLRIKSIALYKIYTVILFVDIGAPGIIVACVLCVWILHAL